ncbi:MAG: hypothetical protein H7Z40_21595 [Phycisphaerae bacterium]|nr:hypothetical protein [Gemmatimonadaceae bacterium]
MNMRWISVAIIVGALIGGRTLLAQPAVPNLAGEWRLEFSTVANAADPASRPARWLTFTATLVQVDSGVGGAMRSDGPSGQFGCKRRGNDVCTAGRMRLS